MKKIQSKLIVAVGVAGLLFTAAIALGLSRSVLTADSKSTPRLGPHTWTTMDQDDFDAGLSDAKTDAETICKLGVRGERYAEPAAACIAAYKEALDGGKFERAMQYAAIGCQMQANAGNCRRVGGLPLVMGNADVPVPAAVADELKRIAEFVCLSGARFTGAGETDITGRECAYFAQQYVLAKDPEYAWALEPAARQFFEAIHDPARAVRLYKAACQRWGYARGCESELEVTQSISLRNQAEVAEAVEREAGAMLIDASALASGLAYEGALSEGKFDQALRYAAIGCEKHKDASQCREAANLPLRMGNQGIMASPVFVAEVKRMADFVCLSGNRIHNAFGTDVTGRTCEHFALQFSMARDPEWAGVLTAGAQRYAESIYDPSLAGKLYQAACERWSYRSSCRFARSLAANGRTASK